MVEASAGAPIYFRYAQREDNINQGVFRENKTRLRKMERGVRVVWYEGALRLRETSA